MRFPLRLKGKLLLFSILPILLMTTVVMVVVRYEMATMGESELAAAREDLFRLKREELKQQVETSISVLRPLIARGDEQSRQQAREMIRAITYGEDGYVFVYDLAGNLVAYQPDPSMEGLNRHRCGGPRWGGGGSGADPGSARRRRFCRLYLAQAQCPCGQT